MPTPPPDKLQVLLPIDDLLVAGLPTAVRNARAASEALSPDKIVFYGRAGFHRDWAAPLRDVATPLLSAARQDAGVEIVPDAPLLVISPEGLAAPEALKRFVEAAKANASPTRWAFGETSAGAYYPDAKAAPSLESSETPKLLAPPGQAVVSADNWKPVGDPAALKAAEDALFASLPQESDGYLARRDRALSMTLSRLLVRAPITPNHITTFSLLLGLWGALLLAVGDYLTQVAGALLLWTCCILDGCDGEVARLKFLASRAGGLYDVIADNVVHLAVFVAIPLSIGNSEPEARLLLPGALLVGGVLCCMFSVWWLILRRPQEERGEAGLMVERIASRDFLYLVLIFTVIGKLHWFLWAAGVGSNLFNAWLWWRFRPQT